MKDKWLNRIMIMVLLVMSLCGCAMIATPEVHHKLTAIIGLSFGIPGLTLLIRFTWKGWTKRGVT